MGCATGVMTSKSKGYKSEGISYFLPRNDVRVVFTNTNINSEIRAATKELEMVEKEEKNATEDLERAQKALRAADPTKPEEVGELKKLVKAAAKTLAAVSKKRLSAEKDLEKKKGKRPQILIEVLPPVPDTSQLYVAALDHSIFYDDAVTFKTSPEGLLTQVTYKGEDQTGEIIQNLVETGIEAAKLYARLHGLPIDATPEEESEFAKTRACTPEKTDIDYYWEFTIDPSNSKAVAEVNRKLIETPLPFLLNIQSPIGSDKALPLPDLKKKTVPGLLYRRAIPYTVEILEDQKQKEDICRITKEKINPNAPEPSYEEQIKRIQESLKLKAGQIPTSKSQQVLMAAGGPVALLEFGSRPFVTTDLKATFKQGILLDSSETRPSEGVGFSMIPLNALRAVGDAVGSFVTNIIPLKIDYTNKNRELIEAETELEKAKQANAELQKKVLNQFESGD